MAGQMTLRSPLAAAGSSRALRGSGGRGWGRGDVLRPMHNFEPHFGSDLGVVRLGTRVDPIMDWGVCEDDADGRHQ